MKTHYMTDAGYLACNSQVGSKYSKKHKETTCLKCIENMNDSERTWHDDNNPEWSEHVRSSPKWRMVD